MVEFDENPYLAARAVLQKRIDRGPADSNLLSVGPAPTGERRLLPASERPGVTEVAEFEVFAMTAKKW